MDNAVAVKDFSLKFKKLNKQNQKYILAIEQAMLFAQDAEEREEQKRKRRTNK